MQVHNGIKLIDTSRMPDMSSTYMNKPYKAAHQTTSL